MSRRLLLLIAWTIWGSTSLAAEPLGRLFFTPEQRALFDRQRRAQGESAGLSIRLDGVATRSRNKPVAWVNGRRYGEGVPDEAAGLRVGESIDLVGRRKMDVIPNDSIRLSRPR